MSKSVSVAIIGAGPYGLSLAAHLRKKKVKFRIFGKAMGTWLTQMPAGMHLKSEGFASNVYDPEKLFPLEEFCRLKGISYQKTGLPVSLETFTAYGLEFQRRFVPELEEVMVNAVEREAEGFRVGLENGESLWASQVVVAAGIGHFQYIPPALESLPKSALSHSSDYHRFDRFRGQDVVVIGAGSSAIDVAVSLLDAGARPQLLTRRMKIGFHSKAAGRRSLYARIRAPWSGLGLGWKSRLTCDFPVGFHLMPRKFRLHVLKTHLGPAPGWFTKEKIDGRVPMHVGCSTVGASLKDGKVSLQVLGPDKTEQEIVCDHVIAGTGYRVDLAKLGFLEDAVLHEIRTEEGSPVLTTNFESTVRGLFFVGTAAALSFGPLLRFAFGAQFAARRLSRHLTRRSLRAPRVELHHIKAGNIKAGNVSNEQTYG